MSRNQLWQLLKTWVSSPGRTRGLATMRRIFSTIKYTKLSFFKLVRTSHRSALRLMIDRLNAFQFRARLSLDLLEEGGRTGLVRGAPEC